MADNHFLEGTKRDVCLRSRYLSSNFHRTVTYLMIITDPGEYQLKEGARLLI
jgi:hypothetical protein